MTAFRALVQGTFRAARRRFRARVRAAVTRTRGICGARPCLAGTRIHVEACIVDRFYAGESLAEIHEYYPHVTREQIEDAIRWWHFYGAKWREVAINPFPVIAATVARSDRGHARAFDAVVKGPRGAR